ncbi:hypothetical protein NIES2104_56250 [Leptolyngbya sp. NIES-2104]|nr:hypothetical protein NIES2104_56250 [Leptolyngbya sp. NIES-2104]
MRRGEDPIHHFQLIRSQRIGASCVTQNHNPIYKAISN